MFNYFIIFLLSFAYIKAETHDKWIVVTTINYPSEMMKKLASIKNWHLVVVADKKTPKDWHLDNCDFLSVEAQEKLPYKIIQHLPWNHYCRKNIGYLYAIEHGATIIYDTDDDNMPITDTVTYLPEQTTTMRYITHDSSVNPYAHFGQPAVWPRGYPLTAITSTPNYQLQQESVFIPVQQGCVNKAPDVDAIFRLTQDQEISFEDKKAVSIPAQTACPFNSQNTIFYKSAFWGLLIPITVSFRASDIWRSYWVQRMLWDMQASLCFLPATAIQYRNDHNLLKDFEDELEIYLKTEKMITAIRTWHSGKPLFADRIQDLMATLIKGGFFKPAEMNLLNAWLEDLRMVNYEMPVIN